MIATGQTFTRMVINLDGGTFANCRFENCNLVFHGTMPFSLQTCDFVECQWAFAGAASLVVKCMSALYGQGEGGRTLIESFFAQIRREASPPAA